MPALHASMSMLSFAPAARTAGCAASIATAGSFCLFCENGAAGLPLLTRVLTPAASATPVIASRSVRTNGSARICLMKTLPCLYRGAESMHESRSDRFWLRPGVGPSLHRAG